jgi:hypothetical protein
MLTAYSFRSQVATPEAINDHESGIAVHAILAARNRKRQRKRDFAVAMTEKIVSDAAGIGGGGFQLEGLEGAYGKEVSYGRAVLAVAERVGP